MITHFSPLDMDLAHKVFGAMCGHGALAAALGIPVMDVMQYFKEEDLSKGWVNTPMMQAAIFASGRDMTRDLNWEAGPGVALVQFLGKWMNPGVPAVARCAHRHWVAWQPGKIIWDSNIEMWISFEEWETWLPQLYSDKTTGHNFATVWSII